jgi:hypothetical protein
LPDELLQVYPQNGIIFLPAGFFLFRIFNKNLAKP